MSVYEKINEKYLNYDKYRMQGSDILLWEKTLKENNYNTYKSYLIRCPEGKFRNEANNFINNKNKHYDSYANFSKLILIPLSVTLIFFSLISLVHYFTLMNLTTEKAIKFFLDGNKNEWVGLLCLLIALTPFLSNNYSSSKPVREFKSEKVKLFKIFYVLTFLFIQTFFSVIVITVAALIAIKTFHFQTLIFSFFLFAYAAILSMYYNFCEAFFDKKFTKMDENYQIKAKN